MSADSAPVPTPVSTPVPTIPPTPGAESAKPKTGFFKVFLGIFAVAALVLVLGVAAVAAYTMIKRLDGPRGDVEEVEEEDDGEEDSTVMDASEDEDAVDEEEDADAEDDGGAPAGGGVPPEAGGPIAGDCESTLTAEDLLFIEDWSLYANAAQGYSFRYPADWIVSTAEDDFVVLEYAGYYINFQFRSDAMSAFGIDPSYTLDSQADVEVYCQPAVESAFSMDTERLRLVTFEYEAVPHVLLMTYTDLGASVSGDIIDAFHLIMKTIEFE